MGGTERVADVRLGAAFPYNASAFAALSRGVRTCRYALGLAEQRRRLPCRRELTGTRPGRRAASARPPRARRARPSLPGRRGDRLERALADASVVEP